MPANPALAAFIRNHFRSVWALELLLFLKNNSSTSWRNDALVQALRASDAIVTKSVDTLVAGGLIILDDSGARYVPATDDLRRLIDETQALYASKPDAVRRLIVLSSGADLSAFADSFRLRRD